ncbi:MAG: hypothetical protein MUC56_16090 [Thermoanaerobaculales bacterium]|jgi:hypothetical protein|nr:hypothetical protein [Thermoanaerobaculales bacterium]
MHVVDRTRSRGDGGEASPLSRPRVVLFTAAGSAHAEVLELPDGIGPGHRICHDGRTWTITGSRTGTRVLIAEPEAS